MSEPVPDPVSFTYVESEKLADVEAAGSDFKESKDGSVEVASEIDDKAQLAETEALEARLASGEATDAEYKVRTSHDVAVKVLSTRYIPSPYLPQRRLISRRDDVDLPVLTFRMFFLGLGFSAFGCALSSDSVSPISVFFPALSWHNCTTSSPRRSACPKVSSSS
jgi:hypothetical protein